MSKLPWQTRTCSAGGVASNSAFWRIRIANPSIKSSFTAPIQIRVIMSWYDHCLLVNYLSCSNCFFCHVAPARTLSEYDTARWYQRFQPKRIWHLQNPNFLAGWTLSQSVCISASQGHMKPFPKKKSFKTSSNPVMELSPEADSPYQSHTWKIIRDRQALGQLNSKVQPGTKILRTPQHKFNSSYLKGIRHKN